MIYIPLAVILLGVAGIEALASLLGFVIAVPIVVAIFVLVEKEDVVLPGERGTEGRRERRRRRFCS
jgi:hypothetical protein